MMIAEQQVAGSVERVGTKYATYVEKEGMREPWLTISLVRQLYHLDLEVHAGWSADAEDRL